MNRLQNRLGKVEGKLLPKSRDAILMRVPDGQEHWPRINVLLEEYRSRDCILWTDSGKSLPNRPLWQPFDIDDLDGQELDDVIADVKVSIATTEPELSTDNILRFNRRILQRVSQTFGTGQPETGKSTPRAVSESWRVILKMGPKFLIRY